MRVYIKLLAILFIVLAQTIIPSSINAADGYGYVGGGWINLPGPTPPVPGATIYSEMWSSSSSHLAVSNSLVKILSYYTGNEYVECSYWYAYSTPNGGESHAQGKAYYTIACNEVKLFGIPSNLTMQVGEVQTIDWTYSPTDVIRPELSWSSSDYSVVEVNSNIITAKKRGTATITVKSNAGPTQYISVSVSGGSDIVYVNSIALNETSLTMNEGNTRQLEATVLPYNATDKSVSWSSSNTSVATVTSSGLVTAMSVGSATITCKANDGSGKTATCSVTVNAATVVPTSISVSPSSKTVKVGDTFYCSYTLSPSNATTTVTWSSDNSSIAAVNSSGKVTAKSVGSTYINAKTANGKTDWCMLTVESATLPKLVLSASPSGGQVSAGTTVTLTAKADGSTVSGCDIYYTTNGTTPSRSNGTKYSSGITINSACTLKAIAYKSGYEDSDVLTATYTITPSVEGDLPQVATGEEYTLFIKPDGTLWTFGANGSGQLGDGTTADKNTPIKIMNNVAAVSAGAHHTLIVKNDGTLWACGSNWHGELGDGTKTNRKQPVKIMENVASASAGLWHSLILKTDGTLWACGSNEYGQLCDGTTEDKTLPVKVMEGVVLAYVGSTNTFMLKNDGYLWACGDNRGGYLGDGTFESKSKPVKIMSNVRSVSSSSSAGSLLTLIVKTDNTLWACGSRGCFGSGEENEFVCTPMKIMENVESAEAGESCAFVIKSDHSLWGFGDNYFGQMGDGNSDTFNYYPIKLMDEVNSISCCLWHSAIVRNDGSIWTCGRNSHGQLGDGTTTDRFIPFKVLNSSGNLQDGDMFTVNYNGIFIDFKVTSNANKTCELIGASEIPSGHFDIPNLANGFSITGISEDAFAKQQYLSSIYLPSCISKIDETAFRLCYSLESITVDSDNKIFDSRNNCNAIIRTGSNELIVGSSNTVIPSDVVRIGANAFSGRNNLSAIVIPPSVRYIDSHAFYRCGNLAAVEFSPNISYIDTWAFGYCNLLNSIELPENISSIGTSAFNCQKLSKVISHIRKPFSINEFVFDYNTLSSGKLYVPYGTKSLYAETEGWKNFKYIEELQGEKLQLSVSVQSGEVEKGTIVYLNSEGVNNVDIYYTLNGTTPTKSSTKYTAAGITINEDCTLKAIAYKDGYEDSDVLTATYTAVYVPTTTSVRTSSAGYATFFNSESAYTLLNGLSAQVVTGSSNGKLTYKAIADGSVSGVVPKGVPVMLVSDNKQAGTFTLTSSESTATYSDTNLLRGSDEATTTTGDGYHYKLSYGPSGTGWKDVFGWYWGAQNGAPFQIEGHKAWLVVPRGSGTRAAGFSVDGEALGIGDVNLDDNHDDNCYDLQGRRVSQPAKKGIYIRNGKKVVK